MISLWNVWIYHPLQIEKMFLSSKICVKPFVTFSLCRRELVINISRFIDGLTRTRKLYCNRFTSMIGIKLQSLLKWAPNVARNRAISGPHYCKKRLLKILPVFIRCPNWCRISFMKGISTLKCLKSYQRSWKLNKI